MDCSIFVCVCVCVCVSKYTLIIITIVIIGLLCLCPVYINVFIFLVSVPPHAVRPHAFPFPYHHQPGHPPFPGYVAYLCASHIIMCITHLVFVVFLI